MKITFNPIYVVAGIFGAIIAALVIFGVLPLMADIQNNSANLLSIKQDTAALQLQNSEIEHFKTVYESYKPKLQKMDGLFIDPQNPVDLIKFLEDTASAFALDAQISLVPAGSQAKQQTVSFQLFVRGNFENIVKFLGTIEHGPYLVDVKNIEIQKAGAASQAPLNQKALTQNSEVSATLLITTFTKK